MALHSFSLAALKALDGGRVAEAFAKEVMLAIADCEDRPNEAKARKVLLQMELVPVADDQGDCDGVRALFQIKGAIPTRVSKPYSFGLRKQAGQLRLVFSDEDPTNHRQLGFHEVDPETGERDSDEVIDE